MKKTLTALAVLSAFAGSAMAADVTLYGKIDAGLGWTQEKVDFDDATIADTDTDTLAMKSGQNSASRFGIKGTEDLGNGMKVGFVLENGFKSDTGAFNNGDKLFDRQATLFVNGAFGEIAFGRVGALSSGVGSYSTVYNNAAFGTGWGDFAGSQGVFGLQRTRMDNTVTYKSPEFAGVTVMAQYSFQTGLMNDTDGKAVVNEASNMGDNQRYAGLAINYKLDAFNADLVVDTVRRGAYEGASFKDPQRNEKDSLGVSLGASYDFGFVKAFAMGQYAKNDRIGKEFLGSTEGVDGYALTFGASAPVAAGTLFAQVNWMDVENALDQKGQMDGYGLAVAYEYPLSARTKVYTFAAYNDLDRDMAGTKGGDYNYDRTQTEVGLGMVHNF